MATGTVEERLERLEYYMDKLLKTAGKPPQKDWRKTIGMFDDDPIMGQIIDAALKARAEERAQFLEDYTKEFGEQ